MIRITQCPSKHFYIIYFYICILLSDYVVDYVVDIFDFMFRSGCVYI